jgi:2-dehydropantoate 2-reductase
MDGNIAIVGTGANGSCVAADLIQAGYNTTLVDQWPDHVAAMRSEGLTINMPEEIINVEVDAINLCDVCSLNKIFDYVFVMVKAYDTKWSAQLMEPYLSKEGMTIGIQNAMTSKDIAEIVGYERTMGCVIELSSEIFVPGVVQRNTPPKKTWLGIGALEPSMNGRVDEVKKILKNVGKVESINNILSAKWMKLVVNCMCLGPLAMLGLTLSEAMKVPGVREFILKAGSEALSAGQDRGYTIEPIFGLSPDDIKDTNRLLETLFDKLAADIGPAARDCVLQDHLKGRYSEVDMINGLVAEESMLSNRPAPANLAITKITKRIQNGELQPDPSNLKLAIELMI